MVHAYVPFWSLDALPSKQNPGLFTSQEGFESRAGSGQEIFTLSHAGSGHPYLA